MATCQDGSVLSWRVPSPDGPAEPGTPEPARSLTDDEKRRFGLPVPAPEPV